MWGVLVGKQISPVTPPGTARLHGDEMGSLGYTNVLPNTQVYLGFTVLPQICQKHRTCDKVYFV